MTLKELSQLYYLRGEIEEDEKYLEELRNRKPGTTGTASDGMPKGNCDNKIEKYVADIVDLENIIALKKQQCIYEKIRLVRYIAEIDDSLTRRIFKKRFIKGLSWTKVAFEVGGGNTEDSVKKICYRYIKKHKNESCPECPDDVC